MKLSNQVVLLLLFLCLLIIPACGSPKEAPSPNAEEGPTVTEEQVEEIIPTPSIPAYTAPLTGLPLEEPVVRRPLAVMINNAPAARPQSGLNGADIVYEVLAEGGVTRLVAIFQTGEEVARIGPIRSIRPYMIDLGESYHGVLVHAGASNDAYAILQRQHKEDLDEITNAGAYFWRDKSRKAPHNLYSNLEKLMEGATKRKYAIEDTEVPSYTFRNEDDPGEGNPVSKVEIKFLLNNYQVAFEYDPETKLYNRLVNGELYKDRDSDEVITATNVVVMGADHQVLDDVGRLSVNLELGGEALLFQRGKVIEGRWIRNSNDVIRFVKDNVEVPFYPGTTYFNIVPNSPEFSSHVVMQ
ncbi:DUF3048 domain-containing protein [Paenibacillus segetis]|uniref:Lipoprotein YerB n=1 Tax=Paenibacillus segetis TaxID=1325360 RepID=A0ABQ1Y300_9BACL|nr:DUF3048 domain-containing protein [Paenibacillus segetis]GGH10020.1 putative lipoprotein YerB [Paenibacillus segetis]